MAPKFGISTWSSWDMMAEGGEEDGLSGFHSSSKRGIYKIKTGKTKKCMEDIFLAKKK